MILIIIIILLGLMKQLTNFYKNVTRTRLNQLVIILFGITGILAAVFTEVPMIYRFYIVVIPASVWAGYFFLSLKKIFLAEIIFTLLLGAWVYNYFFS